MIDSQKAFNTGVLAMYFIVKLHEVLWLQRVQYVNGLMHEYSIIFAIVHKKTQEKHFPQNMSYFSKVNLIDVVEKMSQSGYNVKLAPVDFVQ